MKELTFEKMRYSVPKVRNRFFAVHARFILLCALTCVFIITVALSYITIKAVYRLEPKASFFFFCEVEDIEKTSSHLSKFDDTFNIFLVRYEESLTGSGDDKYNFTDVDEEMEKYNNPNSKVLLVLRTTAGGHVEYTYEKLGFEEGTVLNAAQIEEVIGSVRD